MIKLGRHGIFKRDIKYVSFNKENYDITVYLIYNNPLCDGSIIIFSNNLFQYYWNVFKIRVKLMIF